MSFYRRLIWLVLLPLGLSCLDPDDGDMEPVPANFIYVPSGSFRMGEDDGTA